MNNKRIDDVVVLGKPLQHAQYNFDVYGAKILTAITLMPTIGLDYDFVYSGDGVSLNIFSNNNCDENFNVSLDMNGTLFSILKIKNIINGIYERMRSMNLLNSETETSLSDRILWTALDYIAQNSHNSGFFEEKMLEKIENKVLQLDTFRKIISQSKFSEEEFFTSFIATTLASINLYTNNDDRKFSRTSVNERTFFQSIADIATINRAILKCGTVTSEIINKVSARSVMDERKSQYLSGLYLCDLRYKKIDRSSQIDVDRANILDKSNNSLEK